MKNIPSLIDLTNYKLILTPSPLGLRPIQNNNVIGNPLVKIPPPLGLRPIYKFVFSHCDYLVKHWQTTSSYLIEHQSHHLHSNNTIPNYLNMHSNQLLTNSYLIAYNSVKVFVIPIVYYIILLLLSYNDIF